jgi:hypothetical protein
VDRNGALGNPGGVCFLPVSDALLASEIAVIPAY